MRWPVPVLALALSACGDTGQQRLQLAVSAQGSQRDFLDVADARFTLSRAELGFGPLYLCATEGAEVELCEVALGELLETVTIDGLAAQRVSVGTLAATTGSVRSALYDYGISWLLTEQEPRASQGAPEGHSLVLAGAVTRGSQSLQFETRVDIKPTAPGDAALNALKTERELAAGDQLTLQVDPYRWLTRVNVDKLFELDEDGDGQVVLDESSQAYQALVLGMTNSAPVQLVWSR